MLISILCWILFGLIVGAIARLLVPGRAIQGWGATVLLGIVGSVVGGMIAYLLQLGVDPYQPAGWICSIIGAMVALFIYRRMSAPRLRT